MEILPADLSQGNELRSLEDVSLFPAPIDFIPSGTHKSTSRGGGSRRWITAQSYAALGFSFTKPISKSVWVYPTSRPSMTRIPPFSGDGRHNNTGSES